MGRHRKPKALSELDGTFERHPERRAQYENEPKPVDGPLGPPPPSFNPQSQMGVVLIQIWHELAAQAPPGVLTTSDRMAVEMACRLIHRVRFGLAKAGDFTRLESLLGKFAMTPVDRTKVNIEPGGAMVPKSVQSANVESPNTFSRIAAESSRAAVN